MGLLSWIGKRIRLTDSGFWSAYFGTSNYAGKSVTAETAMQLSAVWSCVRLLSETIATLPVAVYRQDTSGRKTPARDHPLYSLLHDQPNADFTAAEYWEGTVACLCLWGNAYSERTSSAGLTRSLTLLRPDWMEVFRTPDGALRYRYHDPEDYRELGEDEIFHVRGFGVGLDVGLSPIAYARHSLGSAMAADEAAAKMFANGVQTSGFLSSDTTLTKEQREQFRENLKKFMGSENAGKLMVLEAGLKYQPLTLSPEDAQMLQTRAFNVEEICRWFRVPPFMIGHTEKSTSWGTGLEQQNIAFLTYALRPYLTRIEQAIKRQLIPRALRGQIFAEFNLEGLLRADSQGRAQLYSQMAQNGIMTRNEIRAKENLEPKDGGDDLTVQSNLVPLPQLGDARGAEAARESLRAWLGIESKEPNDAA